MLNDILDVACKNGATETLVDLLKKQNLTEEQAYFLLSLACKELSK